MASSDKIALDLDPELYGDAHNDPFLQDEEKLPINELITRILVERKSFLNLTEESLHEELESKNNGESNGNEPKQVDEEIVEYTAPDISIDGQQNDDLLEKTQDEDSKESDFEKFQTQKQELANHIGLALNETSLSLDFVSLLISAVKPNVGKATMSPHLNKNIPLGSLGADRLGRNDEKDANEIKKNSDKIGYGWKYQALNNVTKLFRNASTNLNEQILKERQYWSMVRTVLDNDEVLFRMRDPIDGSKAIGVKYGFGDSGSSYHDKGLAVLRKDSQNGSIEFNSVLSTNVGGHVQYKPTDKVYKYVRVKILSKIDDDFMLTGQSRFESELITQNSQHKIVNDIEKARFFLFEEDLFYHLTREAKSLINYNVSLISNKILIEINNEIIEIESVMYDENNVDDLQNTYQNTNELSSLNNKKAQSILTFTKLMLCCYYNYNLRLKQKIPTSVTKWKQTNTHPLILRPLLGHIRHQINISNMNTLLETMLSKFDPAKLKHKVEILKYSNIGKLVKIENAFQKSIEKPLSTFKIFLENLNNKTCLKIDIEITATEVFANLVINLSIIKYDNEKDLDANEGGTNLLQINFTDLNDIEECLNWTILKFLK